MDTIKFELVTPERTVLSDELSSLSCPTTMGEITILPHHIPLVAELQTGELHAKSAKGDNYIFVSGGFVQINPGSQVIVLADTAEHHFEIDEERAKAAMERAQKELEERNMSAGEHAAVAAALERSLTRINIARRHAHRKSPISGSGVLKNE